jgi:hypothetical protein
MKKLLMLLAIVSLAACASLGKDFDMGKAYQLQPGISTEADAIALLGNPIARKMDETGKNEKILWQYAHANGLGMAESKRLVILFDEDGKMMRIIEQAQIN